MNLYTSYETSKALKEAGAPQTINRWCAYYLLERGLETAGPYPSMADHAETYFTLRAFRADEIQLEISALGKCSGISFNHQLDHGCNEGNFNVFIFGPNHGDTSIEVVGDSMVEAMATAWLRHLRGEYK